MNRTNKILGILILIILIGSIILAYSFNSYYTQNIFNESSSNDNNNSLNKKSVQNNSEINKTTYISKTSNNNKYSSDNKNNKIKDNKVKTKSNSNETKFLTKREACNIAKKAVAGANPGDTSYTIQYSTAKYHEEGNIKYWKFPVSDKVTKKIGFYVCVDVETRGHWGVNVLELV